MLDQPLEARVQRFLDGLTDLCRETGLTLMFTEKAYLHQAELTYEQQLLEKGAAWRGVQVIRDPAADERVGGEYLTLGKWRARYDF